MPLPQPTEYDDAIQNPRSAFADAELKNSTNDGPLRFGMPGPVASGKNLRSYIASEPEQSGWQLSASLVRNRISNRSIN